MGSAQRKAVICRGSSRTYCFPLAFWLLCSRFIPHMSRTTTISFRYSSFLFEVTSREMHIQRSCGL